MKDDLRLIRQMLQDRASELAAQLAPGGKEHRGVYTAPNPTRADANAGSFRIETRGIKAGSFVDYAGVNAPFNAGGDRGDVIDLIAYCRFNRSRKMALTWARAWLGLSDMKPEDRKHYAQKVDKQKREREKLAAEAAAKRAAAVTRLWTKPKPDLIGTLGERYLQGRAIDIRAIPGFNHNAIRFEAALEYWMEATRPSSGMRLSGPSLPAIICAIQSITGIVTGVHCTFLDPIRAEKSAGRKAGAKLMFGTVQGSVVFVSHGRSGLSPAEWLRRSDAGESLEQDTVILAEGLEDSATLAEAVPDARVWMVTSLGNLGNAPIDHPCIERVIIARDNDWQKPQAVRAFDKAWDQLAAHHKPLAEMSAAFGKDFNDQAQTG